MPIQSRLPLVSDLSASQSLSCRPGERQASALRSQMICVNVPLLQINPWIGGLIQNAG